MKFSAASLAVPLVLFGTTAAAASAGPATTKLPSPDQTSAGTAPSRTAVRVVTDAEASPRELYGADRLRSAIVSSIADAPAGAEILAGQRSSSLFAGIPKLPAFAPGESEAYRLLRRGNRWLVTGSDASGVLYGCMELSSRIRAARALPDQLDFADHPALRIRATNLFWMKTGGDYDWSIVPENFPWFFNRDLMTRYLNLLAENRFNTIVFWNGHPFPYFLALERFPEARMLNDADLKRNMDYLRWFTSEADRRGIWTVFEFFNIHVSPAFAKAHQAEGVHLQNPASTPLLADYTRYCIREFVSTYPNVGLMVTAGEALRVEPEKFVRDTIIAGIKDTGKDPPLIIRQWTIDHDRYRDIIRPAYDHLFTMMKHNTEMIVSPYPDPRNAAWAALGPHIINMHEIADVKPFRWGSPVFIQQMVKNWKAIDAQGMHIYPMTSWMWPDSLDRTPLLTMDRDWIWLEAFGRYGWNPDRLAADEEQFWKSKLSARFGSSKAGDAIYSFYTKTGPILPGIQNTINIYNMNYHPTAVAQEATLNGILFSDRWEDAGGLMARPLDDLSLARYEEEFGRLGAAARKRPPLSVKEYLGIHEAAPDPVKLSQLYVEMATEALKELHDAQDAATREPDEYARFVNDAACILDLARFYHAKIEAAIEKGLYDQTGDETHYQRMLAKLDESLAAYRDLDQAATPAYKQPTDLGDWYRWSTTRESLEAERAFYGQQSKISSTGADVVYLGLDGPMNDAGNAFHWLLEKQVESHHLLSQSYHLGADPFRRAQLVVVYDTASPDFARCEPLLESYVRGGGKVLFWDPLARASIGALLEGIHFKAYLTYHAPSQLMFANSEDPLVEQLAGKTVTPDRDDPFAASIASISSDWRVLAWAGMSGDADAQFSRAGETFGPRWTSLMDPARIPVFVVRRFGKGEVALAQLGDAHVPVGRSGQAPVAPAYLKSLTENLSAWLAQER